eukprot:9636764-Alexandrium_andersonii.AAC.1
MHATIGWGVDIDAASAPGEAKGGSRMGEQEPHGAREGRASGLPLSSTFRRPQLGPESPASC